jgi:hypothetical protein
MLIAPDGRVIRTLQLSDDRRPERGTAGFSLCDEDAAGLYTIESTLQYWDQDGGVFNTPLPSSTFTMRKALTQTTLNVSTRRPRVGQSISFVIDSRDERATGYFRNPRAPVRLETQSGRVWQPLPRSSKRSDLYGQARLTLRYDTKKPVKVRAVTMATAKFAASSSPTIRIRPRRAP